MNPVRLAIFIFLLILIPLVGWGLDLWLNPKYPARVNGEEIVPQTAQLKMPHVMRKPYTSSSADAVARLNLFREERKPYQKPKPIKVNVPVGIKKPIVVVKPKPVKPKLPVLPPPQIKLTGVVLHGSFKVALFEGTYSEFGDNGQPRALTPRKKGYKVGEFMGEYQVQTIGEDRVTLEIPGGQKMTLRLLRKAPPKTIGPNTGTLTRKPRIKRRTTIKKRQITPSYFQPGPTGAVPFLLKAGHRPSLPEFEMKGWVHA